MSLGEEFKRAMAEEEDWNPPDGGYTVKLIDGGAFTGRTDGKRYVKLRWQVIGTDNAGRQFEDFKGIDNPVGKRITGEKLTLLGVDFGRIDDIEDLDHAIFNVIGTEAEITTVQDGRWLNVTVQSVKAGTPDIPTDPAPAKAANGSTPPGSFAAAIDDDTIPF